MMKLEALLNLHLELFGDEADKPIPNSFLSPRRKFEILIEHAYIARKQNDYLRAMFKCEIVNEIYRMQTEYSIDTQREVTLLLIELHFRIQKEFEYLLEDI